MKPIYLIDGARTAFGTFGGSLKSEQADDLGAVTAREALKRSNVSEEQIDHIVYGNVIHSHTNAAYLARHIGLKAGIPQEVPALTLNRLCGSGAQSIISAVQSLMVGDGEIALAGGAENMSMAPFANFEQRFGGKKWER